MKQQVIDLFNSYPGYAFVFSILINVFIALLGVVPSVFLTAANILFFGFWEGTLISFGGEAIGAMVAFLLYRYGFKQKLQKKMDGFPKVKNLIEAEGKKAFLSILSLRLIPFIPSGIITFAAAIGKVAFTTFLIASSLGKIPALLLEAYAAYQVTEFGWQGKIILLLAGMYLIYLVFKKRKVNAP